MRDPHVVLLRYRLVPLEGTTFKEPTPPLDAETTDFAIHVEDEIATLTPKDHYPSEATVRTVANPVVRAWEIQHNLWAGHPEIRFDFLDSEIIDRDPPPPGNRTVYVSDVALGIEMGGSATATVARGAYPPPPDGFAVDADVETLWIRWVVHAEGRDSLQNTAHFCLTVLKMHGGLSGSAARFAISSKVLRMLGRLSTETGDAQTARKMTPNLRPLEGVEQAWIEAAVKAIIRRAAEVAADPNADRRQITMANLPPL